MRWYCSSAAKRSNSSAVGRFSWMTASKRFEISSGRLRRSGRPRHADDAAALGQRAVAEGLEEGGQQLAPGQVARAAEKNRSKLMVRNVSRTMFGWSRKKMDRAVCYRVS